MDPDAGNRQLQNKVIFDVFFYFCRRGKENFHAMTKNTFALKYDAESGISHVEKVQDEQTKNHCETNAEIVTGFMPQMLDDTGRPHKYCPVRSFENYLGHLHPDVDHLWQTPLNKIGNMKEQNVWYKAEAKGHSLIEKFMGNLSSVNLHQSN